MLVLVLLIGAGNAEAQSRYSFADFYAQDVTASDGEHSFPDPKAVMRRSLIVPGWGQVTNKQIWKVPIVYGLMGGLTFYSITLTKDYHDYRAAYYNATNENQDFRFGPTPAYLVGQNSSSIRNQRDFLRNRRDFIYVTIGLAYLLNVVDAYVYAHLRPFDVSDNLTLAPRINMEPGSTFNMETEMVPVLSFTLSIK